MVPDPGTPPGGVPRPGYPLGGYPDLGTPPGGVPDPGTPGGVPGPGYPPGGVPDPGTPPRGGVPDPCTPPGGVPDPGTPPGGYLTRVPPRGGTRTPPPPPCGQTNKVKLLPSRRTTYAGGNNKTERITWPLRALCYTVPVYSLTVVAVNHRLYSKMFQIFNEFGYAELTSVLYEELLPLFTFTFPL